MRFIGPRVKAEDIYFHSEVILKILLIYEGRLIFMVTSRILECNFPANI